MKDWIDLNCATPNCMYFCTSSHSGDASLILPEKLCCKVSKCTDYLWLNQFNLTQEISCTSRDLLTLWVTVTRGAGLEDICNKHIVSFEVNFSKQLVK